MTQEGNGAGSGIGTLFEQEYEYVYSGALSSLPDARDPDLVLVPPAPAPVAPPGLRERVATHLDALLESVNLDEVTMKSLRKRVAQDLRVEIRGDDKDWRGPAPDTPSTCLTVTRTQVQGAGRGAHLCRAGARSEHAATSEIGLSFR